MKRKFILILSCFLTIAILLNGCGSKRQSETIPDNLPQNSQKEHLNATEGSKQIRIESDTHKMIFQLNGSSAAKALYEQLPLAVTIEDYGTVEKIFYPPQKLDISDTPPAEGPAGTLAYYEPWGDVAIFTDKCEKTNGLYELGEAISGMEQIKSLSGEIRIEKNEESEAENSMPESGSSAQPETHPSSEGS